MAAVCCALLLCMRRKERVSVRTAPCAYGRAIGNIPVQPKYSDMDKPVTSALATAALQFPAEDVYLLEKGNMSKMIAAILNNLKRYTPLIKELVKRDLKLKYRRSVLGYLWSLLNPLLMMIVMTLVFSYMFRFDIPNYPLYLICGQTLFNFFNESTNMAMQSVIQNAQLIKKVYIPKYIFPISKVASSFVTMSFSLVAILIVMLATGTGFHFSILLFWMPLLMLFIFSSGISMLLSALAVQFRDITHLYGVLTMAWMYLTPVFYPIEAIPEGVASVIKANPLYTYIDIFRSLVLYGEIPDVLTLLSGFAVAIIVFGVGALIFRRMQRNFILFI